MDVNKGNAKSTTPVGKWLYKGTHLEVAPNLGPDGSAGAAFFLLPPDAATETPMVLRMVVIAIYSDLTARPRI